jgi:surface antigen
VIPNGQQPAAPVYNYYAAASVAPTASSFVATYGYNGYDRGWCTWYVASRINVPTNWGNANTWDDRAPLSGWTVSTTPRVGAIAQTDAGWAGHVAIIEAVSPDGTMIKYSDMNGLAGFNRVGYSDWVPAHGKYEAYIYH